MRRGVYQNLPSPDLMVGLAEPVVTDLKGSVITEIVDSGPGGPKLAKDAAVVVPTAAEPATPDLMIGWAESAEAGEVATSEGVG